MSATEDGPIEAVMQDRRRFVLGLLELINQGKLAEATRVVKAKRALLESLWLQYSQNVGSVMTTGNGTGLRSSEVWGPFHHMMWLDPPSADVVEMARDSLVAMARALGSPATSVGTKRRSTRVYRKDDSLTDGARAVLEALREPSPKHEVTATRCDLSHDEVRKIVPRLVEAGLVEHRGGNEWVLTAEGVAALN